MVLQKTISQKASNGKVFGTKNLAVLYSEGVQLTVFSDYCLLTTVLPEGTFSPSTIHRKPLRRFCRTFVNIW